MFVQRNIKFTSSTETIPLICLDLRIHMPRKLITGGA